MVREDLIVYKFALQITLYNDDGNVVKRFNENHRTRLEAVKRKRVLKKKYDKNEKIFTIDLIKLSEDRIVESSKSKRLRKKNGKIQLRK